MRNVHTRPPSFPATQPNVALSHEEHKTWQVLCGDENHWRAGLYSPEPCEARELVELERHDCPELFLLMRGRIVLLLAEASGVRELELETGKPVLVSVPHAGYCPDGPHTGMAFVVERDSFDTEYRAVEEWRARD